MNNDNVDKRLKTIYIFKAEQKIVMSLSNHFNVQQFQLSHLLYQ